MKQNNKIFKRLSAVATSLLLVSAALGPILLSSSQVSALELGNRQLEMSSAVPGATGVVYDLTFTPSTTESSASIVLDFCSDSPIIGATCAFNTTAGSNTVPTFTSAPTASTGTVTDLGSSPYHTIAITGLALTAGTPVTITLTGFTNPSVAASFYGRLLTYSGSGATAYVPASTSGGSPTLGSYVDSGGLALSTTNTISVTATVEEQLTFCASGAQLTGAETCSSATTPAITLGSGSPQVLGTTASTASIYTQLSSNALNGVTVNMKALNSCSNGGLSSNGGSTCAIPGVGSFAAAPASGTAFFGLNVADSTLGTGGSGTVTANSNYGTISGDYGMNGTNLTSTYGDSIMSSTGPVEYANNDLTFAAQAAFTTPAGVYTANESLIATGNF